MLEERFILASERIREIPEEKGMVEPAFEGFFQTLARFILAVLSLAGAGDGEKGRAPLEDLFGDIRPGRYEKSYACPSFACQNLGEDPGRPLSVLYYEIFSMILPALAGSREEMLIRMELFLEVYQAFVIEFRETGKAPEGKYITGRIRDYLSDYFREEILARARTLAAGEEDFSGGAVLSAFSGMQSARPVLASLSSESGCGPERAAEALAEKLQASSGAEGPVTGSAFTCGIGVSLGADDFAALTGALNKRGIRALPYMGRCSLFDLREDLRAPAFPWADPRFGIDHREDLGLFLDESLRTRILQALEGALSQEGEALSSFMGWILPGRKKEENALRPDPMAVRYGRHQRKLLSDLSDREEEMIREAGLFLGKADVFRLPWAGESGL